MEFIIHKRLSALDYDGLVENVYMPPFLLDVEDLALLDPTVAALVAHSTYLPVDRKGMAVYDTDVMGSNMLYSMVKTLNMAMEFNLLAAKLSVGSKIF